MHLVEIISRAITGTNVSENVVVSVFDSATFCKFLFGSCQRLCWGPGDHVVAWLSNSNLAVGSYLIKDADSL